MEEIFIVATIITIIYCVSKYLEYNYFNEGVKPLKDVVRDCLLVLICSSTGAYLYFHFQKNIKDFFNVVTDTKILNSDTTEVFTDTPSF